MGRAYSFILTIAILFSAANWSPCLQAQGAAEEKFQDIFVTAGYATAFGAALGAACLSFFDNPQDHLQYVAVGASLGFIGGSVLGTYVALSPAIASAPIEDSTLLSELGAIDNSKAILIRPVFNPSKKSLTQIEGAWTLREF